MLTKGKEIRNLKNSNEKKNLLLLTKAVQTIFFFLK